MVGAATIEASIGFDWLDGAHFPVSGLSGDLVRVGVLDFRFGVAPNVEVEFDGVGQNFLEIERRDDAAIPPHLLDESSTNDVGDFSIATKIQMRPEGSFSCRRRIRRAGSAGTRRTRSARSSPANPSVATRGFVFLATSASSSLRPRPSRTARTTSSPTASPPSTVCSHCSAS
jgi:hypothetical protein